MTATQCEFTLTRHFDAPRDLVYRVWTESEHMSQWLAPNGVTTPQETISQDLRVGGLWRWTMVNERTAPAPHRRQIPRDRRARTAGVHVGR